MSFAGACIRGWFVARHKPEGRRGLAAVLPVALGALTLIGVVVALAPSQSPMLSAAAPTADASQAPPSVDATEIHAIVEQRCVPCHSSHPSNPFGFNAPPNGIVLETLDQLRAHLPEVQKQVSLRTMPLGNLTGMTDTERATLLMWIGHGTASHLQ
jgi:uncharacterized membrane protein